MSWLRASYVEELIANTRAAGITLLVDTDGRLKAFPSWAVMRNVRLMRDCYNMRVDVVDYLSGLF